MKGTSRERERYFPIASITTFVPRWTIKGRLVDKQPAKPTKTGKTFFTGTFVDAAGDAIRATFWSESCEKWSSVLQEGKVYTLGRGRVSVANKKFNNLSHNYELIFDTDAEIHEVADDSDIGSSRSFSFMSLRDIRNASKQLPFSTDILVVVKSVSPATTVATKQGSQLSKRVITVVDDSEVQFDVTVWGAWADNEEMWRLEKVIALSDISIRDWQSTRMGSSQRGSRAETKLSQAADVEAAERLQKWYDTEGHCVQYGWMRSANSASGPQSNRTPFERLQIADILSSSETGFIATGMLRKVMWRAKGGEPRYAYPGCPSCKKKLLLEDPGYGATDQDTGSYSCAACNDRNVTPEWKYAFSVSLADFTGSVMVRVFSEQGTQIVGHSPSELREWSDARRAQALDWNILYRPLTVVMAAKQESYQGETRTLYSALKVEPIGFHAQALRLMQKIREELSDAISYTSSHKRHSSTLTLDTGDHGSRYAKAVKTGSLTPQGRCQDEVGREQDENTSRGNFPGLVKNEPSLVP